MCTGGINYTQFKLAVHQLGEFQKKVGESIDQWKAVVEQLGLTDVATPLQTALDQSFAAMKALQAAGASADRLSEGGDSVTITPL